MQAEAQFRYDKKNKRLEFEIISLSFSVLKDRKKTDKTIIDSQERAFWRVMRPSVSRINYFVDLKLIFIRSRMKHLFWKWIFEMIYIHSGQCDAKKH